MHLLNELTVVFFNVVFLNNTSVKIQNGVETEGVDENSFPGFIDGSLSERTRLQFEHFL